MLSNGAQEGLFGQEGCLFDGAAYASPTIMGGQGLGPAFLPFGDEPFYALYAVNGFQHGQGAHILTAAPLRGDSDLDFIPGTV